MKRLFYIISLVFLAASCAKEVSVSEVEVEKELTVPVILSLEHPVTLQAQTKADPGMEMGINPAISTINIAIFGSSGYLKDYTNATPCDSEGNPISDFVSANATTAYFLARLPVSTSSRIVHIIANGPSSLSFNAYENDIMQSLMSTDGNGAYWQRLELPGIYAEQYTNEQGQVVYREDANGDCIPTQATKDAFSNLVLVRNFAAVTVNEIAPNFELVAYTLCNMPKSGSIAIYSTNHSAWVSDYASKTIGSDGLIKYNNSADVLTTYAGFPTEPELNTAIPQTANEFNSPGVTVGAGETMFVYERAVTPGTAPFILMAARWVESGDPSSAPIRYYRLDIIREDEYIPLYRNYQYEINITGVSVQGYADPGTAAKHNSGDNFSVSLDTQTLPDISNGVIRLFVQQPNFDFVYTPDQQACWYKLLLLSDSSILNGNVTVTEKPGGTALASFAVDGSDTGDKRYIRYTLNEPSGSSTLSSTLKIVGTYTDGLGALYRLVREVNIFVFNTKEISPFLSPDTVAPVAEQFTTLSIPLPWDLQHSMFPMEILVEDSEKALNPSPVEDMPVLTRKSLTDNTSPSYCFVRTLNWSEYEGIKNDAELAGHNQLLLNCELETTKAFSSTEIFVYNQYFKTDNSGITTARVTLNTDANNLITPAKQDVNGTSASVTVKSAGSWTLSIAMDGGGVASGTSLSPSSGTSTSGTAVTVTLPLNDTGKDIHYKLTLYNSTSDITRTAYITQRGVTLKVKDSELLLMDDEATVNVAASFATKLMVYDDTNTLVHESTTIASNVDGTDYVIPLSTAGAARTFTVKVCSTDGSFVYTSGTITQKPSIKLTTANENIKGNITSTTINLKSDVAWTLSVTGGSGSATLSQGSGSATSSSGTNITLTMPVNYDPIPVAYKVTAQNGDGSMVKTITITQSACAVKTKGASFTTTNSSTSGFGSSGLSKTINDITAAFSAVARRGSGYLQIANGQTLTLSSSDPGFKEFTGVTMTYYSGYKLTDVKLGGSSVGTLSTDNTTFTWDGTSSSNPTVFTLNSDAGARLRTLVVSYEVYSWD